MNEPKSETQALIAYIPVIHSGYLEWFQQHADADMYVLDQDVLNDFPDLRKDIRALSPQQASQVLDKLRIFPRVRLLGKTALEGVPEDYEQIIMPNDEVSRQLNTQYFSGIAILEPIFLRWDRESVGVDHEVEPDRIIKPNQQQLQILERIYQEGERATNIWRGVGAVIITKSGIAVPAHNTHIPTEYTPYVDGDPRSFVRRGVGIEITTDVHAETLAIGWAARNGIELEGAAIHIDTFPCPLCAKQIATAGIKECYFVSGYASLDGESVLRNSGVELIQYDYQPPKNNAIMWRPYPEKANL